MRWGVVIFPGSNCDQDAIDAIHSFSGQRAEPLWYTDDRPIQSDIILLPGGFTYGDYLRVGALAARTPIMRSVRQFSDRGGAVLGICNGFQILVEAGLLPGMLITNRALRFICRTVTLRVETADSRFAHRYRRHQIVPMAIAHHGGNYQVDQPTYERLVAEDRIAFRYVDAAGELTDTANVNGSSYSIAGVYNEAKNILGLMPHPERSISELLGAVGGRGIFESLIEGRG